MKADFTFVGGGIFGLTAALKLRKEGFTVCLLNSGPIPDPLASSTDISKIIRMEYGSDVLYMHFAARCIDAWHDWNDLFGEELYRESGFLLLCSRKMGPETQPFEWWSFVNLQQAGMQPERLESAEINTRFPAFASEVFVDGFFHRRAGYARSGRVLEVLAGYARELGVRIVEDAKVIGMKVVDDVVQSVCTDRTTYTSGEFILTAGPGVPVLLPELDGFIRVTGHPVFHLAPPQEGDWTAVSLPVFAADISRTGWYGFPLHPDHNVIKIANHGKGERLHPHRDDRVVHKEEYTALNGFLARCIPGMKGVDVVSTRKCLYTDTADGHFLIDRHPEIQNLTVATGGSGHGFKMAPMLGEWIANAALKRTEQVPERFRWRDSAGITGYAEEARNLQGD